jgi:hypothetical protein
MWEKGVSMKMTLNTLTHKSFHSQTFWESAYMAAGVGTVLNSIGIPKKEVNKAMITSFVISEAVHYGVAGMYILGNNAVDGIRCRLAAKNEKAE